MPMPADEAAAELDSFRSSAQQSDLGDSGLAVPMLESGLSPTPILQGPGVYRWASSEPGVKDEELRSLDFLPPGSSMDGQGCGGHVTTQVGCMLCRMQLLGLNVTPAEVHAVGAQHHTCRGTCSLLRAGGLTPASGVPWC